MDKWPFAIYLKGKLQLITLLVIGFSALSLIALLATYYQQLSVVSAILFIIVLATLTCFAMYFLSRYVPYKLETALKILEKNIEQQLTESETRFRQAFDYAAIGMALVSLQGKFTKVNQSLCQLVKYTEEELTKLTFQEITYPDDLEADLNYVQKLLQGSILTYQMEKRYICKDNTVIWILLSVSMLREVDTHQPKYFIAQIQDIDKQKKAEEELKGLVYLDSLTEIHNRRVLHSAFSVIRNIAKRFHKNLALCYIDLDYFKNVNDQYGHEIGDAVLKIIAHRIKDKTHADDILTRVGGDEFVLLVSDFDTIDYLKHFLGEIQKSIAKPMTIKACRIQINASIGISLYPHDGQSLEELLRSADQSLYNVKQSGRNNIKFYSTEE